MRLDGAERQSETVGNKLVRPPMANGKPQHALLLRFELLQSRGGSGSFVLQLEIRLFAVGRNQNVLERNRFTLRSSRLAPTQ